MMTHITCVNCNVRYGRVTSGVYLVTMFNKPPQPYQIWHADLHECPQCSEQIVAGFGENRIMEHYQPGLAEYLNELIQDPDATVIREFES